MRRARFLVFLLATALLAPAVLAAADGEVFFARGARGDDRDDDRDEGAGNASSGRGGGRSGEGRGSDDDGDEADDDAAEADEDDDGREGRDGLRELQKGQRDEREEFREAMEERREACREANATERDDCERALAEEARAFRDDQREAFEEAREELREAREEARLGRFALANGTFVGRFVSFTWDAASLSILDYTVGGCQVFDRIAILGGGEAELEFTKHGRAIHLEAGDAKLKLHDNPGGVIAAKVDKDSNASLAFTLDGAIAGTLNQSKVSLSGCANWTATLSGRDIRLAGGVASVDRHATFVAHDANPALPAAAEEHRGDVEDAKARRDVGAEVTVVGGDDDDIDEVELDDALDVEAEHRPDGLRVVVNGTGDEGRTIVVNVAPGLIRGDRVLVRFYDEANGTFTEVAITRASSLVDVLDPSDDDGPEFWVTHDEDGTQVLVSIPTWSVHAFEVQGLLTEVPPSVLLGAAGAVAFVAVAGAGLLRRKQR